RLLRRSGAARTCRRRVAPLKDKDKLATKDTNSSALKRTILVFLFFVLATVFVPLVSAAQEVPQLTEPVNDFAAVIDSSSKSEMEMLIRSLQQASGDVVVVATVDTFQPYADIREYAVKLFQNGGRGIGERGKDNGLLI